MTFQHSPLIWSVLLVRISGPTLQTYLKGHLPLSLGTSWSTKSRSCSLHLGSCRTVRSTDSSYIFDTPKTTFLDTPVELIRGWPFFLFFFLFDFLKLIVILIINVTYLWVVTPVYYFLFWFFFFFGGFDQCNLLRSFTGVIKF